MIALSAPLPKSWLELLERSRRATDKRIRKDGKG